MCDSYSSPCSTILPLPSIEVFQKAIDPNDRHFLTSYPHATHLRDIGQLNHYQYAYQLDDPEIYETMTMPPFVIPIALYPHPVPEPSLFICIPVFLSILLKTLNLKHFFKML